jgi:hypothetical protein
MSLQEEFEKETGQIATKIGLFHRILGIKSSDYNKNYVKWLEQKFDKCETIGVCMVPRDEVGEMC